MKQINNGRNAHPTGIATYMLRAKSEVHMKPLINILMLFQNKPAADSLLDSLVPIENGEDNPLNFDSNNDIQLTDH